MTTYLSALAIHAPYTASDSVIVSDDSGLSIANIGSLSLTSLPTPLFFLLMSYMCLPCLIILFRSRLFVLITLLMSYSLTLFLGAGSSHVGRLGLRATWRRCLLLAEVSPH